MKNEVKDIGIDVKAPETVCNDQHCPFHGKLPVRGKVVDGIVVSDRAQKTAIVERNYLQFIPKFERYERRHSRMAAYNPSCIDAKIGDTVKIAECRPLSKTKSFVIVEIVKVKTD